MLSGYSFEEAPNLTPAIRDITTGSVSTVPPSPTPLPGSIILLGSGMIGLAGFRRKFKKS